jgi:hypothetical protein
MSADHGKKPEFGIPVAQLPVLPPSPETLDYGKQQENENDPAKNIMNLQKDSLHIENLA